ncbi:Predicted O-linked N-acetylglucosamine transferase, SPINDLY family [Roseateles sp. YR242]|uniref:O-linked N-acetylglucosamine transferase, SPINDLY family protein n=1 Tax=Roseateles sp. YR242 TaxID=1855305 RepID=UPI0008D3919C|nr:tetratricopeptide repeat protein [Roseateles sp. YR242]SEL44060.1 Predicted O-linked N-acetylglucosamine transferase, SPINDLY family [Roseateles sp. YR242]
MDLASTSMQHLSVPAALAPEWELLLQRARDGSLPLPELMDRGNFLQNQQLGHAAAALYETWLGVEGHPTANRLVALYNWGTVLGNIQQHQRAEEIYLQALAISPTFAQARLNLGHQLEHQQRIEEALAAWRGVYDHEGPMEALGADLVGLRTHAFNNAARLLELQRRYEESEALMVRSLTLKPDQTDVMQHYVHIRQKQCKWPVYQPFGEVTHNALLLATSLLATLSATDDPALQMGAAQRFVYEKVTKPKEAPLWRHPASVAARQQGGKIRIGYLSGDLCMHAVGLLTAELYALHDREKFEIHAFCWSREDGTPLRRRLLQSFDKVWRINAMDDTTAAKVIAQAGIDVLVDLQGLTSGARPNILAYRPAPVQVSYLGLPATSLLPGVDWIIADRFVMPPEYLAYCSEKPIFLPHCYQVSDRQREVGATPTRAQYQLPDDAFVFCSFNNNHKMNGEMFGAWMRILAGVPGSVLWLLADNEWAKGNLQREAQAAGVDPARLIFAPRVAPPDYLARFTLPDLVLDTFPYNAGTTASDCLWMGTPILTRSGRSYISRMCGSLLTAVGLPDLITFSVEEYVERAIQIGLNPGRARSYKRYLRDEGRQSELFNMPQIVRDIEREFEQLALAHRA